MPLSGGASSSVRRRSAPFATQTTRRTSRSRTRSPAGTGSTSTTAGASSGRAATPSRPSRGSGCWRFSSAGASRSASTLRSASRSTPFPRAPISSSERTARTASSVALTRRSSARPSCLKAASTSGSAPTWSSNRSLWLDFPKVTNKVWHHGRTVLLGDAAHTAHFSIGSGTKLAMDDAIALRDALVRRAWDVEAALVDYERERQPVVERTQQAASESAAYFARVAGYRELEPIRSEEHTSELQSRENLVCRHL